MKITVASLTQNREILARPNSALLERHIRIYREAVRDQ
jgi:hypothetical protein